MCPHSEMASRPGGFISCEILSLCKPVTEQGGLMKTGVIPKKAAPLPRTIPVSRFRFRPAPVFPVSRKYPLCGENNL